MMKDGNIAGAYGILGYLNLDETITQINKDKQVSDSQIVDILTKRDLNSYKDPEVETGWKPLTEE